MDRLAVLASLSFFLLGLSLASAADCPQNWSKYGNFCYKFSFTSLTIRGKTWEDAENTCQSFGGHLASITNNAEQNFISRSISKYSNDHFWIGYNDRANESRFNWTDGTNPGVFTKWRWNEPNNFKNNEDCVELLFSDGKWNDDDCKKLYAFICKIKSGVPIPTQPTLQPPMTLTPLSCDAGWKHYGTSCYKFNMVRRKWVDARTDCHQSGGYLVKIDNPDEQHYITYTMKSINQNMWIGLNDRAVEGMYIWEGDLTAKNYTNWYSGEPNDHAGNEDCIAIYNTILAGYWNDDYCDLTKGYICEKPNGLNLCPVNWLPYDNSCYQLNTHPGQALAWHQAVNACRAIQGSDLVSIHSSGEQLFLTKQLNDLKSKNVWIGLNDVIKEGSFVWSDKSAYDYKNWGRFEPGSGWSGNYRDCSQLLVNSQNGTWGTSYCSSKNPYVCKMARASMKCNAPFGLANYLIGDSQISASSSRDINSLPSQARLMLQPSGSLTGSWCAANNRKGEYLQIDLGLNRRIGHIALQGRPKSTDFVKSFYITYGNDGSTFITYGQTPTQKFKVLTGNVNADTIADIMLNEKISGRFIRIYPQTWSNNICMRVEVYGCEGQASSTKCGRGWEQGPDNTCYQFNTNILKIWADARAACVSQGGDLLSIVSNKERIFIDNRMKSLASSVNSMWIGLNDRESSKLFYWSDQSPYLITRWDAGYPKDNNNSKSCVELIPSRAAWRDVDCGQYKPFICKLKLQASKNPPGYSTTADWVSATDVYWPLNQIVNGKLILGTSTGKVMGNITKPDILQNNKDVLQFTGYNSYVDAGQYPNQCISNADACTNGLSVSLIIKLDSNAAGWTGKRFIVDSIGDEAFSTSRGFSIYIESRKLKVRVSTTKKYWTLSQTLRANIWQHVTLTWTAGAIKLYINGLQRTSTVYGNFQSPDHIANNDGVTIGSRSTQQIQGVYYMRALAVWNRELSAAEIKDIYNAEFGSCKLGWKEFGQFCYQFNFDQKNWAAARLECQKRGGELTSINSPVEQAHISLEVGEFGLGKYAWIGFHDKNIESAWEWSDGTTPRFTNWYNLQPDNWLNTEHCGHTYGQWWAAGRWNDIGCYSNFAYICKSKKAYIPTGGATPTSAPKSKIICEHTTGFISCPSQTVMSVKSAKYGRTSANQCGQISVTNCRLDVLTKIQSMCDGKTYCTIKVDNKMAGSDPCQTIPKYLEVTYTCKKGPVATPGCPAGWPRSPDGNVCYGLIMEKKSWFDARDSCRSQGAELVSVHSGWESSIVTSLLVKSWDGGDIWIGLSDYNQRGVYRWADNSTVDFTHWFNSEPNDRNADGSCVRATLTSGTRDWMYWMDSDCNSNLAFVCKKFRQNFVPPTKPPTTIPSGPCPSGWRTYRFGCYKVFMQKKTWTAARDSCFGMGRNTNLVSIGDAAENSFVQTLTNNTFDTWIGLNDRGTLSGHLWSDGRAVRFTNWGPAQPDSHSGQQPCVVLKSTGIWNDVGCFSTRPYMCKMRRPARATSPPPSTKPPKATTQVSGICDPDWVYWNQLCYHFANESLSNQRSWFNARALCRKVRGDLVSVRNMAENNFITSEAKKRYRSWNIWIGLNDLGSEGVYTWSDGLPLSFTYFSYKEPNDWMGMEDCVELSRYHGKWNDQSCGLKRPFVCRKHNNTVIPPFTMVPPTPGPAVGICKPGWVNYDKSCYKFVFNQRQNWANAQSVCQKGNNSSMSGNLITIDNVYEQAFVSTMIKDYQGNLWIGLNDLHTEGTYQWISNAPVTYVNWEKGKPSNNYFADCVAVKTGKVSIGRWDIQGCSAFQGYICEAVALPLGPTPVTPTPNNDCPAQFSKFGSSCYMTSYVKSTWYEANQKCKAYGANLVSVHSPIEQAYLVRNMINFVGDVWIGLSREFNAIGFTWSDQSPQEYTHWSRGQPRQPGASKTCVQANNSLSTDGRWTEVDCGKKNGFMCKISKGEPSVTPSLLGQCQPGWTKYEKHCYLLKPNNYLPWPQARLSCIRQGGDLVSIVSRQEQDFLIYQMKDTALASNQGLWIGLNDRGFEGGYQWSDGSPTSYVPWSTGEPNDRYGLENCVEIYPRSGFFNDHICSQRRGYLCKSKLECSLPLGMSGGNITDSQLTASSTLDASHGPTAARLNGSSAWCANASIPNNYIQVDFLSQTRVSKISIKGTKGDGKNVRLASYIRSFTLTYGSYQNQWINYMTGNQPKIISGNIDADSVVTIALDPPIDARFIRLKPQSWVNNICAKLEFYGCSFECQTAMGMEKGRIKDTQLKVSSSTDGHEAAEARPINKAWCPVATERSPWLQIVFPAIEKRISQITTWGAGIGGSGYVTKYKLAYSDDGDTWLDYTEKGVVRIFRGNNDLNSPMKHILGEPIITQFFRIKPLSGGTGGRCMRFEIYGCANGCLDPLGLEKGTIEDSWLSASSSLDGSHKPEMARLNAPRGWCAASNSVKEYLKIDLSRNMRVRRIATQGSAEGYVTSFTVSFTRDDIPWKNIFQNGAITIFTGNTDATSIVSTTFPKIVRGRYFRINPKKWFNRICLRVELYGCVPYIRPTPSVSPTNSPVVESVYKVSMRLTNIEWTADYTNKTTTEYKALSIRVITAVRSIYSRTSSFSKAMVTGFRRGSVIVDFRLIFVGDATQTSGATDKLKKAVKSGRVGDLEVDPNSFNITKIDGGNTNRQSGGRSDGLSSGGKAAIAVVFVILVIAAGVGAAWYFLKKKRGSSQFIFKQQQFDNPIHFSSKAYDMDG